MKEELKKMVEKCIYSEYGITYMSDKQYNIYIDTIDKLQQENKQLKEIIDKAIEYMNKIKYYKTDEYIPISQYKEYKILLDILIKVRIYEYKN